MLRREQDWGVLQIHFAPVSCPREGACFLETLVLPQRELHHDMSLSLSFSSF